MWRGKEAARLPAWLSDVIRPAKGSFPWGPAARGALCVAGPLLAGMWLHDLPDAVAVSLGAVWAISNDRGASHRQRTLRIAATGLAAAIGLLVGGLILHSGQTTTLVAGLTAVAAFSGGISARGPLASAVGMHLLLAAVVGSGMAFPGPLWQAPALLLVGSGLLLTLSALPALWHRHRAEEAATLALYQQISDLLAAIGTEDAVPARQRMTLAINHAQDQLAPLAAGGRRRDPSAHRLMSAFAAALPLCEAATTLLWDRAPIPGELIGFPVSVGQRLLAGGTIAEADLPAPDSRAASLLRAAARQGTHRGQLRRSLLAGSGDAHAPGSPRRWAPHVRYAAVLSGSILAATLLAVAMHGPRAYWLPLAVGFILKPDVGPLLGRAVNRCLGTIAGVLVAALCLGESPSQPQVLIVVTACGALMAVGVAYHFGLATLALTPVVLTFIDLSGDHENLLWARVFDTVLAAAMVLVADFLVWPQSWHARAETTLAAAIRAATRFLDGTLVPDTEPMARHHLRHEAYRRLAEARHAVTRARAELPSLRPSGPPGEPVIAAVEHLCDAITARGLRLAHSESWPDLVSQARIDAALSELTGALAVGRPKHGTAEPGGDPGSALLTAAGDLRRTYIAQPLVSSDRAEVRAGFERR